MFLATLASHDVTSFSLSLASSSKLKFFKEGGVMDSVGGMFSLSELRQSGSSKNLGFTHSLSGWKGMAQSQRSYYYHSSGQSIPLETFSE